MITCFKSDFHMVFLQKHPDKNPHSKNSHVQFIAIQEAYSVLSNTKARELYDSRQQFSSIHKPQRPAQYSHATESHHQSTHYSKNRRDSQRHGQRHYTDSTQYEDFYRHSWRSGGGFYSHHNHAKSKSSPSSRLSDVPL